MKFFDRRISHLVVDLNDGHEEDASRITHLEQISREVCDEFLTHKMQIYENIQSYVDRDIPEVNEILEKDEDEPSHKVESVTSQANDEEKSNKEKVG